MSTGSPPSRRGWVNAQRGITPAEEPPPATLRVPQLRGQLLAGPGQRWEQGGADLVLCAVLILALVLLTAQAATHGVPGAGVVGTVLATAVHPVVFVLWPWTHQGQTPGMRLKDMCIEDLHGGAPSLGQYVLRWLLLIVDSAFLGLVGVAIMRCSRLQQRLGDMAAGTVVLDVPPPSDEHEHEDEDGENDR